jgi:hypothetical protein
MAVAQGYGKTVTSGSVFAYDVADTRNSYRGEPTTNVINPDWSAWGTDASGFSTLGTRTLLSTYHVRIVDVNSNTRQSLGLYSGISASTTYTFSVKFKKIAGAPTLRFQIYSYVNGSWTNQAFPTTTQIGISDIDEWQTATYSYTTAAGASGILWYIQDGDDYVGYNHSFELKEVQMEAKSHATPFVAGTRSATQGLLPLVGNSTIDLSNVSFDSNAQITFDGTNDYILKSPRKQYTVAEPWTIELVFKPTTTTGYWNALFGGTLNTGGYWMFHGNGTLTYYQGSSGEVGTKINYLPWDFSNTFTQGVFHHLTICYSPASPTTGVLTLYYNGGQKVHNFTETFVWTYSLDIQFIGAGDSRFGTNDIHCFKEYNRALSAAEVRQNYLHYKTRFNLS